MSKKDHIDRIAREEAPAFWYNLGDPEDIRRPPPTFMFVCSKGLDPRYPEVPQRRRNAKPDITDRELEEVKEAERLINHLMYDVADMLLTGATADAARQELSRRQPLWQNVKLVETVQEFEQQLRERYHAGDNFADLGYMWRKGTIRIDACYMQDNPQEAPEVLLDDTDV